MVDKLLPQKYDQVGAVSRLLLQTYQHDPAGTVKKLLPYKYDHITKVAALLGQIYDHKTTPTATGKVQAVTSKVTLTR